MNWFHRLFNPHCADCNLERIEKSTCQSCETLRAQLDVANNQNRELLRTVLELNKPITENVSHTEPVESTESVRTFTPWRVKRQILEANDREAARILAKKEKELKETEKSFEVKVDPKLEALEQEVLENAAQ